ncbi:MFS transporter [Nocardioides kribbensis]|uniref:MFS transporter n=1 Tax=Nocardioides kribbensis TaxID=305517 RepID=UPI003D8173C4
MGPVSSPRPATRPATRHVARTVPLVLVGVLLLALNLRPAAVSVGPVLAEVRSGLGLGAGEASLLTSLPVLAFAVLGALAPATAARVGLHRTTLLTLLAAAAGLVARVLTDDDVVFLAASLLAVGGMAMANVLLPSLVKLHFPDRIGPVTSLYTAALAVGLTLALTLTVPISEAGGGFRWGLGTWALLAVIAALPWVALVRRDRAVERGGSRVSFLDVARTRLGWAMAGCFGLQALQAYAIFGWFAQLWRDAGWSPTAAGALVGLLAGTGIPLSLWLPRLMATTRRPRALLLGVIGTYPVAYLGMVLSPWWTAPLWAVVAGVGACTFPLVLTLIGLRARTPEGTAALSAFSQSVGYLLAALGPFAVGLLNEATGGWTVPLLVLTALVLPMAVLGAYVARPVFLEDALPPARRALQ